MAVEAAPFLTRRVVLSDQVAPSRQIFENRILKCHVGQIGNLPAGWRTPTRPAGKFVL
jgi:hypothetical protein